LPSMSWAFMGFLTQNKLAALSHAQACTQKGDHGLSP